MNVIAKGTLKYVEISRERESCDSNCSSDIYCTYCRVLVKTHPKIDMCTHFAVVPSHWQESRCTLAG